MAKLLSPADLGRNWSQLGKTTIGPTSGIRPSKCNVVTKLWGKEVVTTVLYYSLPKSGIHFSISEVVGTVQNRAELIKQVRLSFSMCPSAGKRSAAPGIPHESLQLNFKYTTTIRGKKFTDFDYILIGRKYAIYLRSVGSSTIVLPAFSIAEHKLN
jgi:hypothetical protein